MNCESARKRLSLFLYGELPFDDEEEFEQHLEECDECRGALASEKAAHRVLDLYEAKAPAELLAQCRRDLRTNLERDAAENRGLWRKVSRSFSASFMRPVGAVALVALGFFAARVTTPTALQPVSGESQLSGPVATEVGKVQRDPSGNLRIVVNETRPRVLSGSPQDERIQDLLLDAAGNASDPDLRDVSIDILAQQNVIRFAGAFQKLLSREANSDVRRRYENALRLMNASLETF